MSTTKKLKVRTDLEFSTDGDAVAAVDHGANPYADIAFSKSAEMSPTQAIAWLDAKAAEMASQVPITKRVRTSKQDGGERDTDAAERNREFEVAKARATVQLYESPDATIKAIVAKAYEADAAIVA